MCPDVDVIFSVFFLNMGFFSLAFKQDLLVRVGRQGLLQELGPVVVCFDF